MPAPPGPGERAARARGQQGRRGAAREERGSTSFRRCVRDRTGLARTGLGTGRGGAGRRGLVYLCLGGERLLALFLTRETF